MATPEALKKYYDCLRDSFNKIQNKDNAALINAALRPKIREELAKSKEVLTSYLNYIQVFSIIYSDKFPIICSNIVTPLFREFEIEHLTLSANFIDADKESDAESSAVKLHKTIRSILKSKTELTYDFVQSAVKVFPHLPEDEKDSEPFSTYLRNCLVMCQYLNAESREILLCKLFERLTTPDIEAEVSRTISDKSYELIYQCLGELDIENQHTICLSIINVFTRDFLTAPQDVRLNYLLFYISSLDSKLVDHLLKSLWEIFTDDSKSLGERKSCVDFACSLISRATYIGLEDVFKYLETACEWALTFIQNHEKSLEQVNSSKSLDSFNALTHSIFYIITQRYREMYEEETLARLSKLNLTSVIESRLTPLEACDSETRQRFSEVATLYNIGLSGDCRQAKKRRKSELDHTKSKLHQWALPFQETCACLPERIHPIYRNYYNHRNFTIYRD